MPRSEAADEQQVEPNPRISSTGGGPAATARTDAGCSLLPARAPPWPRWCEAEATAKPARATPRTRAMASTTAIGATGIRRVTADRLGGAGTGAGSDRVSGLVREVVTPYQARALTTPTRPATGMAQP